MTKMNSDIYLTICRKAIEEIDFFIERSKLFNIPIYSGVLHPNVFNTLILDKKNEIYYIKDIVYYKEIPLNINAWMTDNSYCLIIWK